MKKKYWLLIEDLPFEPFESLRGRSIGPRLRPDTSGSDNGLWLFIDN